MRILQVVPYYEEAWAYGGIPRVASAMSRGLVRRGHDVTVCTTDVADARSRAAARPMDDGGVTVRMFRNLSNHVAYRYQFFTPRGLSRYLRHAAHTFDLAHLHACHHLPGALAARWLRRAHVPYVVSPNGTAPRIERRQLAKLAFDATIGRHVLPYAARVFAVSTAERIQLQALGIELSRLRVVANPIDSEEFSNPPDGRAFRAAHGLGDAPVVMFLGKLSPRKGVDVLVRAFARLARRDARLVIAGNDFGSGPSVLALAAALGLGDRSIRVDLLRGRERLDALAAATLVVYPSRDEVFGLVAVEALLCGTPVIVCDDSGCGEIVRRIGGGQIVPYGDPAILADAIQNVLDDPHGWTSRARAAADRAGRGFGADAVCAQVEAVYREVLADRMDGRLTA